MTTQSAIFATAVFTSICVPGKTQSYFVTLAHNSKQELFLRELYFIKSDVKGNGTRTLIIVPAEKDGKLLDTDARPPGTVVLSRSAQSSSIVKIIGKKHLPIRSSGRILLAPILKALPSAINLQDGFRVIAYSSRQWGSSYYVQYLRGGLGHDSGISRWIDANGVIKHQR